MSNGIVVIDRRLNLLLEENPAEAVRLILQEYQIAYSKEDFVAALAAKLVLAKSRAST